MEANRFSKESPSLCGILVSSNISRDVLARMDSAVNEAESKRVEAEQSRVTAEAERASNHEILSSAAIRSREQFEHELQALRDDPEHYMTPGARRYFNRVRNGYIILAFACAIGIWALANRVDAQLRDDINSIAEQQCIGSIPTLNKFNNLVDVQIESNRARRALAEQAGDEEIVAITTNTIIKLQKSKLRVPNAKECSAPLLK